MKRLIVAMFFACLLVGVVFSKVSEKFIKSAIKTYKKDLSKVIDAYINSTNIETVKKLKEMLIASPEEVGPKRFGYDYENIEKDVFTIYLEKNRAAIEILEDKIKHLKKEKSENVKEVLSGLLESQKLIQKKWDTFWHKSFSIFTTKPGKVKEAVDLFVFNGTVVTMNQQKEIIQDGGVVVRDGKIIAVGLTQMLEQKYNAKKTIDAHGGVILPGFINTHGHAPMTLFRGLADDLILTEWLQKYVLPAEKKHVTPDFVYWGTKLACYEMIKGGTTTFVDMYFFEKSVAQAAYDMGMRAIVGETITDASTPDNKNYKQALAQTEEFIKKWKNNPLITPAVAPHALYSCSKELLLAAKKVSEKYDIPLIIHVSETKNEVENVLKKHKMRPVVYLDSLGLLNEKMIAAHCVHLNDTEIALLKKKRVGVAHCPISNMKLSSGIAPVYDFLKQGVLVGLGTDGATSNNSLDMFAEMKTASLLQKVTSGDPIALPAYQALELATIGAAQAIHMDDHIGSLEVGKKADIIIVKMDQIHQIPVYNVISQLVYATKASDVQTVIIDGKIIMEDGVIDSKSQEKELRQNVKGFKKSIFSQKV